MLLLALYCFLLPCVAKLFSRIIYLSLPYYYSAVNTSARMETMGIPGCINLSTAARQALTSEVAACRNGRSIESWLNLSGTSLLKRDPVEVKGKGFMDMYLLCPKGVPPPLARRLSSAANMATRRSSYGSEVDEFELMRKRGSHRSLVSRGSRKSLISSEIEEEKSVVAELEALKKEHERLQVSERSALAEVESLQLSLAEATAKLMSGNSGKRTSQASSLTSPPPSAVHTMGASSSQQSEELKLQLLVTTKALMRARQALLDKEAEIDLMELEMQRLRAKSRGSRSTDNLARMADAMSVHTKRSSFLARTQNLLGGPQADAPPLTGITRQLSSGNVSSIGLSHFDDLEDESSIEEMEGQLKS